MRPSAQPCLRKWVLFAWEWKMQITHFRLKGCAPSLILKVTVFETRKWPIGRLRRRRGQNLSSKTIPSCSSTQQRSMQYHAHPQNGQHTKRSIKGYNSIASSVLFFSRRYEAYLASSVSISLMLCCFASSIAWSHWFSWTQQSIASFTFPVCRNRNTKAN